MNTKLLAERRRFMAAMLLGSSASHLLTNRQLLGFEPMKLPAQDVPSKRIVLSADPVNLEFPFASLNSFKTPTEMHYVRSHYSKPSADPKTWRVSVSGAVNKPISFSVEELKSLGSVTKTVTLECAGNGRSFLSPKVKGVQWAQGGISTADWTGVPLASVLEKSGVDPSAVEVILDGADKGDPKKEIQPVQQINFSRSLPLAKALAADTMLVWGMNGADLLPDHGAPLRAIVAGWYGMASVKWLSRIIVSKTPFQGFDQTIDYAYWSFDGDGLARLTPITEMQVKSSIARPQAHSTVKIGVEQVISGAAWAGGSDVTKVEVSVDGGKSWREATLIDQAVPFCWRRFELRWTPREVGPTVLQSRAIDAQGRTQPTTHDLNRRSYQINVIQSTPVMVSQ